MEAGRTVQAVGELHTVQAEGRHSVGEVAVGLEGDNGH